jgi:hypothetical protein
MFNFQTCSLHRTRHPAMADSRPQFAVRIRRVRSHAVPGISPQSTRAAASRFDTIAAVLAADGNGAKSLKIPPDLVAGPEVFVSIR